MMQSQQDQEEGLNDEDPNSQISSDEEQATPDSNETISCQCENADPTVSAMQETRQQIQALLRRIRQLENLTGLPAQQSSKLQVTQYWLIYQINMKLHLLGIKMATTVALLVLAANIVFVVVFSVHQRRQCVATTSIIEGDLSPQAYREIYQHKKIGRWNQEIFICHCQSVLVGQQNAVLDDEFLQATRDDPNDDIIVTDDGWIFYTHPTCKSCTLPGFFYTDYDLQNKACPSTSKFGYTDDTTYSHGCLNVLNQDDNNDDYIVISNFKDDTYYQDCLQGGRTTTDPNLQQETCVGLVSVVYYTCPLWATAIGASLGYVALVEITVIALSILLYMLFTGKRYTYQDLVEVTHHVE